MSIFLMKLFALIAMLIDLIAEVFGWEGWNLIPFNTSFLRYIGRISFPIFAFSLVVGWKNTHNKEKYFSRILLFALISQIPFSMALYASNISTVTSADISFSFRTSVIFIPIAVFSVVSYWYFSLKRKLLPFLFIVFSTALLPAFRLKIDYIWFFTTDSLNVLYTLALGLVLLFVIDKVSERSLHVVEYIWLFILSGLLLLAYGTNADYGIGLMGVVLIVALYLVQTNKFFQSGVVAVWGMIYYGLVLTNWKNAFATFIPAVFILLYNQKRGTNSVQSKWLFYIFYPLHLLIIGLFNMLIKWI